MRNTIIGRSPGRDARNDVGTVRFLRDSNLSNRDRSSRCVNSAVVDWWKAVRYLQSTVSLLRRLSLIKPSLCRQRRSVCKHRWSESFCYWFASVCVVLLPSCATSELAVNLTRLLIIAHFRLCVAAAAASSPILSSYRPSRPTLACWTSPWWRIQWYRGEAATVADCSSSVNASCVCGDSHCWCCHW